jgi:hypothetical protein
MEQLGVACVAAQRLTHGAATEASSEAVVVRYHGIADSAALGPGDSQLPQQSHNEPKHHSGPTCDNFTERVGTKATTKASEPQIH